MTIATCLRAASLAAITAAAVAALPAQAQDYTRPPSYGTVNLEAGFEEDPNITEILAGGNVNADTLGNGCVGFIANAPDLRLNYVAGNFPLSITSIADADTTLVINAPDGEWYCDDDGAEQGSRDALVAFDNPQSGQYDIWVGTYSQTEMQQTTLFITERVLNAN